MDGWWQCCPINYTWNKCVWESERASKLRTWYACAWFASYVKSLFLCRCRCRFDCCCCCFCLQILTLVYVVCIVFLSSLSFLFHYEMLCFFVGCVYWLLYVDYYMSTDMWESMCLRVTKNEKEHLFVSTAVNTWIERMQ